MSRQQGSDWLSRVNIPDMYPRRDDPFKPGAAPQQGAGLNSNEGPGVDESDYGMVDDTDFYSRLTVPGSRPVVYQRAANFQLIAGATPIAISNARFECDTMVLSVPSTAANSIFFGYGSSVTTTSGQEVRPGVPVIIAPENTREMWELQRALEAIAAILAGTNGIPILPPFRAPRVVFNANEYFVTATVNTTLAVMLFYIPEMQ